jgi:hypothetical protein
MLESDTICRQEASIWELYGVKSETAKNTLRKATHDGFQDMLPMLHRRRADPTKYADMYIAILTSLAESRCKRKAKSHCDSTPLADSLTTSPAASTMAEATATVTKVPHSQTGPTVPVEMDLSVPSEQVRTRNLTCPHRKNVMKVKLHGDLHLEALPIPSSNPAARAPIPNEGVHNLQKDSVALAKVETLPSNTQVGISKPTQARGPLTVNNIAHSHPSAPHPLDVIPMNKPSLRPMGSLKQTAKRAYAPFASITSRTSRHKMNKEQPML